MIGSLGMEVRQCSLLGRAGPDTKARAEAPPRRTRTQGEDVGQLPDSAERGSQFVPEPADLGCFWVQNAL